MLLEYKEKILLRTKSCPRSVSDVVLLLEIEHHAVPLDGPSDDDFSPLDPQSRTFAALLEPWVPGS